MARKRPENARPADEQINNLVAAKEQDENVPVEQAGNGEAEAKILELTELLQRVQAEFENYRKRVDRDYEKVKSTSKHELISKLLPVLDSFEMALASIQQQHHEINKGVQLIHAQLKAALESEGLKSIDSVGKPFDPRLHEAVLQVPSEKDGIVLEELQKGYMIKDKVLRHSKVKIGKTENEMSNNKKSDKETSDKKDMP